MCRDKQPVNGGGSRWALLIFAALLLPLARASSVEPALQQVFRKLAVASPTEVQRVQAAVLASDPLTRDLNELAASGALTEIRVAPASEFPPDKRLFRAIVAGSAIVLSAEILPLLERKRLSDVTYPDDILPDNLTFVLAHLASHLRAAPEQAKLLATSTNPREYSDRMLNYEARAFIQGWNDMLAAAVKENHDRPLSARQAGQLLLNARYRFAFTSRAASLEFASDQSLPLDDHNVAAVVAILSHSSIADIQ